MLGLVARITSRTPPSAARCTSWAMVRSSGPMPSRGERRPPRTWYCPRNSPARSIAPTSDASSTTQMTPASRRGSRQMAHGSSSVRLKQREQLCTRLESVVRACARRRLCSGFCFSRWYVRRSAVLRPMPGSFASSAASSSIALTLERQLERQVEAPGQLAHLPLRELGRLLLRLGHGHEDQVLEHLHVLRIHDAGVDLDRPHLPLAVGRDRDHPAAGVRGHGLLLQLVLDLLQAALHLLRLLHDLHEVGHGSPAGCRKANPALRLIPPGRGRARRSRRSAWDPYGAASRCGRSSPTRR